MKPNKKLRWPAWGTSVAGEARARLEDGLARVQEALAFMEEGKRKAEA